MSDFSSDSAGFTVSPIPPGVVLFPAGFSHIVVGDSVTCSLVPGTFTCTAVNDYNGYVSIYLAGFAWPTPTVDQMGAVTGQYAQYLSASGSMTATFTRLASSYSVAGNYVVAANVAASTDTAPVNVIPLTYVTGLVPGDILDFVPTPTRPDGASFTIADIDSILNNIITVDPVQIALYEDDPLVFDTQTIGQVVFQNFSDVLVKANDLGGTDLRRFTPMVAPDPVLTWIGPQISSGYTGVIYCPQNIQPNLTGIDIATANGAMISGTPETGWSGSSAYVAHVDWTAQLVTAPSSLMLDQSLSLAPNAWPSNRNGALENSAAYNLTEATTAYNGTAIQTIVHDYTGARRILTTLSGSIVTATQYTWTGTAWNTGTSLTWTGAPPNCGIPFPPVASSLGAGASILYLDNQNALRLMWGTHTASLALQASQTGSLLVQTAYGAYLVSQTGYGLITWTGTALHLNWQPLASAGIWMLPTTFTALDANNCYCLVVVQTWDSSTSQYTYAVWAYHLASVPIAATTQTTPIEITASASGTILNVTQASGTITANMMLSCNAVNVPASCYVVSQASGTPGGIGSYNLSQSISLASQPMSLCLGGSYPSILEDPELITGGIPSIITAIKDPSTSRIFGLVGSRLFQISPVASACIERFCVDGMSTQQLIENVAMIQNAYVCPLPDGILHIVSRNIQETAINMNVVILSDKEYMASEYFISQVNVQGSEDTIYAEQAGLLGGLTLEIDNPFCTSVSQCRAVAASYLQFFGSGKMCREVEVTYTGTGKAPWEVLLPSATVTINGGSIQYYVVGLEWSLLEYKATLKLLIV